MKKNVLTPEEKIIKALEKNLCEAWYKYCLWEHYVTLISERNRDKAYGLSRLSYDDYRTYKTLVEVFATAKVKFPQAKLDEEQRKAEQDAETMFKHEYKGE